MQIKRYHYLIPWLLTSCAVGPDYQAPKINQLNIPPQWQHRLPHQGNNQQMTSWWEQFNDPTLIHLIKTAVANNPSLAAALARIKQAQASVVSSKAPFYPTVTLTPGGTISNNGASSVNIDGTPTSIIDNLSTGVTSSYSTNIYASWEIDLFGATRRSVEAAENRLKASKQDWNAARISLVSDVADNYVQYRVCQDLVATYRQQLQSNAETVNLTDLKIKFGRSPKNDANQASASYYSAQVNIEQQTALCQNLTNKLVSLTGISYAQMESWLNTKQNGIPMPVNLAISQVPAQVILQRPDVAAAEYQLQAANADIGAAIANQYPSLSITGLITASSAAASASPLSWALNPNLAIPLTNGGNLTAQVELAKDKYQEALANYQARILMAVNEVEDALLAIASTNQQSQLQTKAVANFQAYFITMNHKYELGSINILDLELARNNLYSAQTFLLNVQLNQVRAWIRLYKASGGSWETTPGYINKEVN